MEQVVEGVTPQKNTKTETKMIEWIWINKI